MKFHKQFLLQMQARTVVGIAALGLVAGCESQSVTGETVQTIAGSNPYSQTFTAFESEHVRPLAITPDGKHLIATNTPDAKAEIFKIKGNGTLEHLVSVPVGLEPVAVNA